MVLTTNPGATLPFQRRAEILAGQSVVGPHVPYAAAASAFASYYARELTGPARRRLRAVQQLAALASYEGVLQVECVPFHSPDLPRKDMLLRDTASDRLCLDP